MTAGSAGAFLTGSLLVSGLVFIFVIWPCLVAAAWMNAREDEEREIDDAEREEAERERETVGQLARFSRALDDMDAADRELYVG